MKKIFRSIVLRLYNSKRIFEMSKKPAIINDFGGVKGIYQNCKNFYKVNNFWSELKK